MSAIFTIDNVFVVGRNNSEIIHVHEIDHVKYFFSGANQTLKNYIIDEIDFDLIEISKIYTQKNQGQENYYY